MSTPLVILISGTSRGLGAVLRAELEAQGHTVYGSSRTPSGEEERELALDVTDPDSCRAAVAHVLEAEGRVDVLINNAGSHLYGAAVETSETELRGQMELNFFGAVSLTQAVLPAMRAQGSGRILNMSSAGGRLGYPFASAYNASKFALEGYMEALRLELLPLEIYVSLLSPGHINTGTADLSVLNVQGTDPQYTSPRERNYAHTMEESARGVSMARVAKVVTRALMAKRPALRYAVDGLAPRLLAARALTPERMFERAVLKQTAPVLLQMKRDG